MKRKFSSMWRMGLTLLVALSLLVFALPAVAGGGGGSPSIEITIDSPGPGEDFEVSDTFNVVAKVTNSGDGTAHNVTAHIAWDPDDADFVGGDTADKDLGDISPGSTQDAQWTLHCTAPGHMTITVTTNAGGSAEVTVQQLGAPDVEIVITNPPDFTKIGLGTIFDVYATVTNTGKEPLINVDTWLTFSGNAEYETGPVHYDDDVGTLAKLGTADVHWTVECTGLDAIDYHEHPEDPSFWTVTYTVITANVEGTGSATGGLASDTDTVSVHQKALIVEIVEPLEGWSVNVCREFPVHARVTNYLTQSLTSVEAEITWDPSIAASIEGLKPALQDDLGTILSTEVVDIPFWHLHCWESGPLDIQVVVVGIEGGPGGLTYRNYDTVTILQQDPAILVADIDDEEDEVCYGISNVWTVDGDILNPSGQYGETATGVTATILIVGNAELDGQPGVKTDTIDLPDITGDGTTPVSWDLHCTGPGNVTIYVTPAGDGYNTGQEISSDNPPYVDPTPDDITIAQLPLTVAITAPLLGPTYSESQTFSVEALVTNLVSSDWEEDIDVTLHWTGDANAVSGEPQTSLTSSTKTLSGSPTIRRSDTQEVAWTMHCNGPEDVTFWVELVTDWSPFAQGSYEQSTLSNEVTVYQETATNLEVTILSPEEDNFDTFVATSQEFAVTARVKNWGEADSLLTTVTIVPNNPNKFEVVPPPDATINIGLLEGGEEVIVTWTLHALKGSIPHAARIRVKAEGTDENSNDRKFACDSVGVKVYRAAHLVIDITDVKPVEDTGLPPYTVNVCDEFDVYYTVTNTGIADAWEVTATLSVTPDGSARPVAGEDSGYTQYIGTLTGHGQSALEPPGENSYYEGTWRLHCKTACESTITITAEGFDEYGITINQSKTRYEGYLDTDEYVTFDGEIEGWADIDGYVEGHVKVTGGFVDGPIEFYDANIHTSGFFEGIVDGYFKGVVTGDVTGTLDGYFTGTIAGSSYTGTLVSYYVDDEFVDGYFDGDIGAQALFEGNVDGLWVGVSAVGNFTGNLLGTVGVDSAVLHGSADVCFDGVVASGFFDGHFEGDFDGTITAWVEGHLNGVFLQMYYVGAFSGFWDGSIEGNYTGLVNGCFTGTLNTVTFTGYIYGGTVYVTGEAHGSHVHIVASFSGSLNTYADTYIWGYLYEFTKTMNPGAPIPERFIEPNSVTVKQLTPVDLAVTKEVDKDRPLIGEEVVFTITVTNNGPDIATGVVIEDILDGDLTYVSDSASKGSYAAGVWTVGQLGVGMSATLVLSATVGLDEPIENCALVSAVDQNDWNSFNDSDCVVLNAAPTLDACINLRTGWNLISLPLIPDDPEVEPLLVDIEDNINLVKGVTTYDASVVNPLERWTYAIYDGMDWDTDFVTRHGAGTMADGLGYWAVMDEADVLCYDGVELELPPTLPPTYKVVEGWNLIGFKSVVPRKAGDYLAAIDGKYTMIYRFTGGMYSVVQASDNMVPGQGFWIAVIVPGEWTIYP